MPENNELYHNYMPIMCQWLIIHIALEIINAIVVLNREKNTCEISLYFSILNFVIQKGMN